MADDLPRIPIPGPDAENTEKMVFMQEQIVNFLRQYSMPLIEVSLVFSKYTRQLTEALEVEADMQGESLPDILMKPWPLLGANKILIQMVHHWKPFCKTSMTIEWTFSIRFCVLQ